jgi:hypothetical protein
MRKKATRGPRPPGRGSVLSRARQQTVLGLFSNPADTQFTSPRDGGDVYGRTGRTF